MFSIPLSKRLLCPNPKQCAPWRLATISLGCVYCKIITGVATLKNNFFSVQSLSCVQLFATPYTAVPPASLSITSSQSLLKLMSIESVMPSNHLILCRPLLLLPSIFPSIRIFSSESVHHTMWPKYWSFSFSISPSNEYSGLISFRIDRFDLLAVQGLSRVFPIPPLFESISSLAQLSLWSNSPIHTWLLETP